MRRVLVLATTAAVCFAVAAPASGHYAAQRTKCSGFVPAIANSDAGAFQISVRGTTCAFAKSVIRSIMFREHFRGFKCLQRNHDDGLSHRDFRCRRGARIIVFVIS